MQNAYMVLRTTLAALLARPDVTRLAALDAAKTLEGAGIDACTLRNAGGDISRRAILGGLVESVRGKVAATLVEAALPATAAAVVEAAPCIAPATTPTTAPDPIEQKMRAGLKRMGTERLVLLCAIRRESLAPAQLVVRELAEEELERRCAESDADRVTIIEAREAAALALVDNDTARAGQAVVNALMAHIDALALRERVLLWKAGKTCLRSAVPPKQRRERSGGFAYVVWRLARFHGGEDTRMSMEAEMQLELHHASQVERDALDLLASAIAREVYGSDLRAVDAYRGLLY